MKTVMCFGDSNTWGYIPLSGHRLSASQRWPGVLARLLGSEYKIEEEGVNGRTTCFDDPICPERCGVSHIEEALITNSPLDLVIIMLGTNDAKIHLRQTSFSVARGMEMLVKTALKPEYGPEYEEGGKKPQVLVVSPPLIADGIMNSPIGDEFDLSSVELVKDLSKRYRDIAVKYDCGFLDAALYTEASAEDCLHITTASHERLAKAMEKKVREMIG